MHSSRFAFLCVLLVISLCGCKREEPTSWETDALFPVAYGTLDFWDLIPDSLLEVDSDNVFHLVFEQNLTDFDLDSLVKIPDTTIYKSFSPPLNGGPFILNPGTTVITLDENYTMNLPAAELREIEVKSGRVSFEIRNYMNGQLKVLYNLPGVTKDGVGLTLSSIAPAGTGENPNVQTGEISLDDYHFDLGGLSGFAFNTLAATMLVQVDPAAPVPAEIFGDDSVTIAITFHEPVVRYARGYFGQHVYELSDTINFGSFGAISGGQLDIGAIDFSIDIDNYVGADAQITLNEIRAIHSFTGASLVLASDAIPDVINVTRALDINGWVQPTYNSMALDEQNSNIDEFIEIIPNALGLDVSVVVNPLGDISAGNDFIYPDQPLSAVIRADLPLCLSASGLTISDTLEISNAEAPPASGVLKIYVENGFPFGGVLNLAIVDKSGTILAELAADQALGSGLFQAGSNEVISVNSIIEVELNAEDTQWLQSANRLLVKVEFGTDQGEVVKITPQHFLDIRVVADVTAEVSFN